MQRCNGFPSFFFEYIPFYLQKINKTLDFQGFSDRLWRRERDSKPGGRQPILNSAITFLSGIHNCRYINTNRPFYEGSHNLSRHKKIKPSSPDGLISLMAEREGFEPSDRVNSHTISSRAPSTNSAISP